MFTVGEDLVLVRQVGAARIDEINARQPVLGRDLLGSEVLLDRDGEIGSALHGGVVGDDHAFAAHDASDARDDSGRGDVPAVEAERRELAQLQERRSRIDQGPHAVARQQLAARKVFRARRLAATLADAVDAGPELRHERRHVLGIGAERGRPGIEGGVENRHGACLRRSR